MHWTFLSAAVLAIQAGTSLAAPSTEKVIPFRCGSEQPPAEILSQASDFARQSDIERLAAHAPIVINTYFHVVTSTAKVGRYTQTQLNNQVNLRSFHIYFDISVFYFL